MLTSKIIPGRLNNILLAVAILAAATAAMFVADGVIGAGPPVSLHSFSFSSVSGTMSSESYGIFAELGSVGFVGRSSSSNYIIQMGTGSTPTTTSTPIPNIFNAPSTTGWGLVALVAGMLLVMVGALRRTSGVRRSARP